MYKDVIGENRIHLTDDIFVAAEKPYTIYCYQTQKI